MKKIIIALPVALTLGACTIANPFGGPPLLLTGNLQADMPGIQAYAASIKAGVKKDAGEVRAMFLQYCPTVADANAAAKATTTDQVVTYSGGVVTQTAAEKQLGNVQAATELAVTVCNGGTATDVKSAFVSFADAVKIVAGWIKAAKG